MEHNFERLLAAWGLRVTAPRKTIFKTLEIAAKPLSHMEIARANPSINKTSVYRTIELLMKLEVVTSVSHGWKQRYELAAPFRPHHHHLHCVNCGKVEEVQSEKLEQTIRGIAEESDFRVTGHVFELTGVCKDCR